MIKRLFEKILNSFNIRIVNVFPNGFDKFLFKYYGDNLAGLEIGVYRAIHANYLLGLVGRESCKWKVGHLYLVDAYKSLRDSEEPQYSGEDVKLDLIKSEGIARRKLFDYGGRYKMIKQNSNVAHKRIKNNSLDFVFIDGDHSYEQTKKDIENYYPKVKSGGVIGGDGFTNGIYSEHLFVMPAVLEFIRKNNLKLYVDKNDWWVIKNENKT